MTCGERVKEVRKSKNMTLEKFGEVLGVKKTTISRIENDVNSLTEQMAKAICREFDVSENWLRTGDGEMFIPMSTDEKYKRAAKAIADSDSDLDRIIQRTLIYYYEMDSNSKAALLNYIQTISALLPVKKSLFDEAPEVEEMLKQDNNDLTGNTG
ncbi:helix-turn-helix transcriptional regulator [[Clostridium] symbiosum]|uniref:helix-turn-helix domain-containing protein n=1 Tax=Clostridium symbiosum TaxID=1512 RepID=UPI00319E2E8F